MAPSMRLSEGSGVALHLPDVRSRSQCPSNPAGKPNDGNADGSCRVCDVNERQERATAQAGRTLTGSALMPRNTNEFSHCCEAVAGSIDA